MSEAEVYHEAIVATRPLMEPIVLAAIEALALPRGSHGLDAGCGNGLQTVLLAQAVGPEGHVTGLDISEGLLGYAAEIVARAGLSQRISLREGDVRRLPFDDGAFDWAWSSCCVGYAPEMVPALGELARVVRPSGQVAILVWSGESLLPGHPWLEARLRATPSGLAPFHDGQDPALHCQRALAWFEELGLEQPTVRTLTSDAQAPLSGAERRALEALLAMRWPGAEEELAREGADGERLLAEFGRLCLPDSPDFILDAPGFYAYWSCSLFWGMVAGQGSASRRGRGGHEGSRSV